MSDPKVWKAGTADEVWKVIVCARDAHRADDLLSALQYILTDAGSDSQKALEKIRAMTGKQIVDGLLAYQKSSYDSVAKAIRKSKEAVEA
jgi:hypothetical protein